MGKGDSLRKVTWEESLEITAKRQKKAFRRKYTKIIVQKVLPFCAGIP